MAVDPAASPTSTPASTPSGVSPATAPPADAGYYPYALRDGRIHRLEEVAATPCSTILIDIVGTFGATAYSPNPVSAHVGDTIIWTNNDPRPHRIVIDDGSLTGLSLGELRSGESSAPFTMTATTLNYHCEYHPSMVGSLTLGGSTTTADPAAAPADPNAPATVPVPDSGYGYYRVK